MRLLTLVTLLASAAALGTAAPASPLLPMRATAVDLTLHKVIDGTVAATAAGGLAPAVDRTAVGSAHPLPTVAGATGPSTILKGRAVVICGSGDNFPGQRAGVRCDAVSLAAGAALMRNLGQSAAAKKAAGGATHSGLFVVTAAALREASSPSSSAFTEFSAALEGNANTVILMSGQEVDADGQQPSPASAFLASLADALATRRFASAVYVTDSASNSDLLRLLGGSEEGKDKGEDANEGGGASFSSPPPRYIYLRRPAGITADAAHPQNAFPLQPPSTALLPPAAFSNSYVVIHNKQQKKAAEAAGTSTKKGRKNSNKAAAEEAAENTALPAGVLIATSFDVIGAVPTAARDGLRGYASPAAAVVGAALHRVAATLGGAAATSFESQSEVAPHSPTAVYGLIGHSGGLGDLHLAAAGADGALSSPAGSSLAAAAIIIDTDLLAEASSSDIADVEFFLQTTEDYAADANSNKDNKKTMSALVKAIVDAGRRSGINFTPEVVAKPTKTSRGGSSTTAAAAAAGGVHQHSAALGGGVPVIRVSSVSATAPQQPLLLRGRGSKTVSGDASAVVALLSKVAASIADAATSYHTASTSAAVSAPSSGSLSSSELVLGQLLAASARCDRSTAAAIDLGRHFGGGKDTAKAAASAPSEECLFGRVVEELYTSTIPSAARRGLPATAASPLSAPTNSTPAVVFLSTPPAFAASSTSSAVSASTSAALLLSGPMAVEAEAHVLPESSYEAALSAAIVAYLVVLAVAMFGPRGAKQLFF